MGAEQIAKMYDEDVKKVRKAIEVAKRIVAEKEEDGEPIGLTQLGEELEDDGEVEFEDNEVYFEVSFVVLDDLGMLD